MLKWFHSFHHQAGLVFLSVGVCSYVSTRKYPNCQKSQRVDLRGSCTSLGMSSNGYGDIERSATDVNLSRLEQISQLFGMELSELIDLNEKNFFNFLGTQNTGIGTQNHCTIASDLIEQSQLKFQLEKEQLIIE